MTQPTLSVLAFSHQPASPAGDGVNVTTSGLPATCKTAYFFFGDTRVGSATVHDGTATEGSISVPGDATTGNHTITVSCESSGKLAIASTTYRIESSSIHRSELLTSLNQPREVTLTAKSIGISLLAALILFILLAFPAQVFNSTLIEHYEEVRGWFGLRRPVTEVVQDVNQRLLFPIFVVVGGILFALLTPEFGFNLSTLALVLGLGIAVLVTTIGLAVPTFLYFGVRRHERGRVLVMPGTLLVGGMFVLVSRLIDFQPGYLYGVLAIFLFRSELDRRREGVLAAASALLVMVAAFLLWWLRVPLAGSTMAHPGFWSVVLESAIGGAFVMGVESTVVAMLPMRYLDGERIKAWSRVVWAVLMVLAISTVIQVLVQPGTGYVGHASAAAKLSVLGLYLVFAAFSFSFWAYFRFRETPEEEAGPGEDEFEREGDLDVR
ncbi:MAG: FGLLP motif-containing membrane protein [Acidimicrobiales bacterium]